MQGHSRAVLNISTVRLLLPESCWNQQQQLLSLFLLLSYITGILIHLCNNHTALKADKERQVPVLWVAILSFPTSQYICSTFPVPWWMRGGRINIFRIYMPVHHIKKNWCGTFLVSTFPGSWISVNVLVSLSLGSCPFPMQWIQMIFVSQAQTPFHCAYCSQTPSLGSTGQWRIPSDMMFCQRFCWRYVWTGYYTVASVQEFLPGKPIHFPPLQI